MSATSPATPDLDDELYERLQQAYYTFTGDTLSRGRTRDLLDAMEVSGLELTLLDDEQ